MKLPSTKRILSYEIWQTDLPRTTTRKLKRFEIEKRVRENESAGVTRSSQGEQPVVRKFTEEDKRWLEQPEVIHALKVIRGSVKDPGKEMHPSDNLELDLGLDSMERVELLVALERELGSHVEDSVSSEVYTVRELVDAVQQAHRATRKLSSDQAWDAVLRIEPTDPHVTAVTQTHRFWTAFWFFLARIGNLLARALFHLKVEGLEKLPKTGPFVISPNHQSFLDGPILMGALPWNVFKETFFVGTSEIFGDGVWRRLARTLKIIPVDPDANLVPAMQAGAYGLRYGKILVLYPEGERSIDGDPKVFKKGAAILATHLHVPIIPVAIDGSFEAWPRSKSFQKFTKIRLCFGEAIYPPPASSESAQTYESVTSELRSRVVGMWERMHVELQTVPLRKDQNG